MIFMPDFMVRFWVGQVKKIQKMRDAVALFHRRVQSTKKKVSDILFVEYLSSVYNKKRPIRFYLKQQIGRFIFHYVIVYTYLSTP